MFLLIMTPPKYSLGIIFLFVFNYMFADIENTRANIGRNINFFSKKIFGKYGCRNYLKWRPFERV